MSKFEDYINGLEGKENLDPLVIASTLHELHNEEIGINTAKIDELTGTVAARDADIASAAQALTEQKARNYDLVLQIPTSDKPVQKDVVSEPEESISIDDLFESKGK